MSSFWVQLRTGSMYASILQVSRCRIQSFLSLRSSFPGTFQSNSHVSRSVFKLLKSNEFRRFGGLVSEIPFAWSISTPFLRSISTDIGQRIEDNERSAAVNIEGEFLDEAMGKSKSVPGSFKGIHSQDQQHILQRQNLKHCVNVLIMDVETTGFCSKWGRIIEFAIRDASGGENSCFQTLVNPEQIVRNSNIHGITTNMVIDPDVPRMKDLIPILKQYIRSRLVPGGHALLVAHNGHCFDFRFLVKEFQRCYEDIPSNWLFLDTLPLARELMKSSGSSVPFKISLQGLCDRFGVGIDPSSAHRAMRDVDLLAEVLKRLTMDLKLTKDDLVNRSVKASDFVNSLKKTKNN